MDRTFSLLIKSHVSEFGCTDTNYSSDNNLKTEMPAWTVPKALKKLGKSNEI